MHFVSLAATPTVWDIRLHSRPSFYFSFGKDSCMYVCVQVVTTMERVMRLKNAALFIDNFESTGLLAPNPVDNT